MSSFAERSQLNAVENVLLVDDDAAHLSRLAGAVASRGFEPVLAHCKGDALAAIRRAAPAFAVIDTHLPGGHGLKVIEALREARSDCCIVVLTGHGSIDAAIAAVKAGAADYMAKPVDPDDVVDVLVAQKRGETPPAPNNAASAPRARWEHIRRIYELSGHNTSQAARRLNMHRRTLQRILAKRAPN